MSQLALGRASHQLRSTRILVAHYPIPDKEAVLLGIVAEHALETVVRDPEDFVPSGVRNDGAPYLGPVATDARGLVQWVDVTKLLPETVRDVLFKQPVGH